jgi:hypothetical protein
MHSWVSSNVTHDVLPLQGMRWRDLFDMVIVNARKPDFFNYNMSL